jgi:hypothetical protein
MGRAAASSNVRFSGFAVTARFSPTTTYWEKAPSRPPKTASPGLNRVTLLPTASTVPEKSTPTWMSFGLRRPAIIRMK